MGLLLTACLRPAAATGGGESERRKREPGESHGYDHTTASAPRQCARIAPGVWDHWRMRRSRRYGLLAIALLALALGLLSLAVARRDPVGSFAGRSALGGMAELGAGWSLVAAGLLFWLRHPANRFGPLLTAAGFAWFLPEWSNPGVGTALGFTVGTVGLVACAPFVAHAALAYPTGRLRSRLEFAVVAVSYAGALLLLGLLPATVFDPKPTGCFECPQNLVLTDGDAGLFDTFNRYGLRIGIGWLIALGAVLLWRLVRSSRAGATLVALVLGLATAYLGLVAWDFQHSLGRGILRNDPFDRRVWRYEALVLATFALAVGWGLLRERRARASIARLVVELGRMPKPGAVRDALRATLDDPGLEIAYRRRQAGGYIDASGRPVELNPGTGKAVTPLLRGEAPVAALVHDSRLLDQPHLLQEVLDGARMAVENEQLQAEVRAQLEELRASRARVVETSDVERRRLERDLHDGAQQRLLALSYDLRLARGAAEANGDPELVALLAAAGDEAQTALGELRELAHGIYPAILAEAGLGPALGTLSDEAPLPIELREAPSERFPAPVETAAYLAVSEAVQDSAGRGASFAWADVRRQGRRLVVVVGDDGSRRSSAVIHLADRIGALGGELEVRGSTLRAVIPCE
jgi:signal transduction histidine kinase